MSTLSALKTSKTADLPSRAVRVIRRDSFSATDRGEEWAYTFHATWWHQVRGVKGFHERLIFGMSSKAQFPTEPTVDDVAALSNDTSEHVWRVSA